MHDVIASGALGAGPAAENLRKHALIDLTNEREKLVSRSAVFSSPITPSPVTLGGSSNSMGCGTIGTSYPERLDVIGFGKSPDRPETETTQQIQQIQIQTEQTQTLERLPAGMGFLPGVTSTTGGTGAVAGAGAGTGSRAPLGTPNRPKIGLRKSESDQMLSSQSEQWLLQVDGLQIELQKALEESQNKEARIRELEERIRELGEQTQNLGAELQIYEKQVVLGILLPYLVS